MSYDWVTHSGPPHKDSWPAFLFARYGYYCGANFGSTSNSNDPQPGKPLDATDACCRYHDMTKWGSLPQRNAAGMVMCLAMAKASPQDILRSLVNVNDNRNYWYSWAMGFALTALDPLQLDGSEIPQIYTAPDPAPY